MSTIDHSASSFNTEADIDILSVLPISSIQCRENDDALIMGFFPHIFNPEYAAPY